MKHLFVPFLVVIAAWIAVVSGRVDNASAHRSWCHSKHACPSDHATYRWRDLLCVAPYSDARGSSFKRRVRYEGRTYYCKR